MTIEITEIVDNESAMVDLLNHISELVEQGFTSGYYPHWKITKEDTDNTEKED